jgi:hypothetical protein
MKRLAHLSLPFLFTAVSLWPGCDEGSQGTTDAALVDTSKNPVNDSSSDGPAADMEPPPDALHSDTFDKDAAIPDRGNDLCQPTCAGKACGASDGCGGQCLSGSCPANSTCSAGKCVCDSGFHDCGGACVSNTSTQTCGSGCSPCPTIANGVATCDGTKCGIKCNTGRLLCGGVCASCPVPKVGEQTGCSGSQCVIAGCATGYGPCAGGCCPWTIKTVDTTTNSFWPSIAVDSKNAPHISYTNQPSQIKHAKWTGSSWGISVAVSATSLSYQTVLDIDGNDHPHIGYSDYDNEWLWHASWDGAKWNSQVATKNLKYYVEEFWFALSKTSQPAFSYRDDNADLAYATFSGGSWATTKVTSSFTVASYSSLAFDKNNIPHIALAAQLTGSLLHYTMSGGSWVLKKKIAGAQYSPAEYPSLALDGGTGVPHVAWHQKPGKDLKYAKSSASSWTMETVDDVGDTGRRPSLAIDSSGKPHICYKDWTNAAIKYARFNGSKWEIHTIASGSKPSLALDQSDQPHVAFRSFISGKGVLRYATFP